MTGRKPHDLFSRNLVLTGFSIICQRVAVFCKIGQHGTLCRSYVPVRIATHLSHPVTHSSPTHSVVPLFFCGAVEWHLLPAIVWDCSCVGLTRDLPLFCVSNRGYIELRRCAGVQCGRDMYSMYRQVLNSKFHVLYPPLPSPEQPAVEPQIRPAGRANGLLGKLAVWSISGLGELHCSNGQ
jgi:hypothetical protein